MQLVVNVQLQSFPFYFRVFSVVYFGSMRGCKMVVVKRLQ